MEDTWHYLQTLPGCNGKVGAVGYCLGGKLCYLMCCRTDIDCAVAYYGTYIEHRIKEVKNLHRPFVLHMAMKDRWVQAEVNDMLERRLSPNPLVTIHKYPGADHAFARHGGRTYSKPEADRALGLTVDFFRSFKLVISDGHSRACPAISLRGAQYPYNRDHRDWRPAR